jgi:hypothetical protein
MGRRPGTTGGEGGHVKLQSKVRRPQSWVIYQAVLGGEATGPKGVCEQAEWEAMERAKPGSTFVVQSGIADEGVAERLARGTSGDPKPRVTRETAK